MKKVLFSVVLFLSLFLLASCNEYSGSHSKDKLENLVERVEKNAESFSENDWEAVFNELDSIECELENCELSKEELHEIGRIKGKLVGYMAKTAFKSLKENIETFSTLFSGGVSGFLESFDVESLDIDLDECELNEDDLRDIEERLKEMVFEFKIKFNKKQEESSDEHVESEE